MTISLSLCVVAIAAAIALAGCGGSSDSPTATSQSPGSGGGETTETTAAAGEGPGKSPEGKGESSSGKSVESSDLSKSEFVKQADAICEAGKKQSLEKMAAFVKQHRDGSQQPSPELVVEAVQAVFIPEVQTQIDEIRALGAPKGDEGTVEAFLVAMEEGAKAASQASVSAGSQFGKSFQRSAELAREYGLDGCAYG